MTRKSPLDDARTAKFAWARFRRLMALMVAATLVTVCVVLAYFYSTGEPVSIHFYIAVGLGVGFMMLLTGALMGLVFLSNGTGHDDAVDQS